MALRASWLARPPTAATNGGRVPIAVLERQRTNSGFTGAWEERRREEEGKRKRCVIVDVYASLQIPENEKQRLTLFVRVSFTSSVSFSKTSASCKHLMASK